MTSFCLNDYDAIAFDMDHTLLRYNLPQLSTMIYNSITEYLRQHKNYPASLLDIKVFENHQDLCMRGLLFDYRKGNFLKLDNKGFICSCSHGFNELSDEEISTEYNLERKFPSFDLLERTLAAGPGYAVFESFYTTPIIPLICTLVEHFDKTNGTKVNDYEFLWKDICEAFEGNFNYNSFKEEKNLFMPSLKLEPWKYVFKIPDSVIKWLKKLRETKVVILITYTFANLAEHLMTYAVDADWKELFHFIIGYARKPAFFQESCQDIPFFTMSADEQLSQDEVPFGSLGPNEIFLRGNSWRLEREVMQSLQIDTLPKFVYFGDSIRGDVFGPSHHTENWDAVAVVEELQWQEDLFPVVDHDGVKSKLKSRATSPTDELLVCSKQWGSFFFDDNGKPSDGTSTNAFWKDVLAKYSKLAIPSMEHLADLPIECTFTFD